MPAFSKHMTLPYTAEQAFSLAADIERYPDFVPGYRAVRVRRESADVLKVEQTVGFGPASWRIASEAHLEPPSRLTILSRDWPFSTFMVEWRFRSIAQGSQVSVQAVLEAGFGARALIMPLWPLMTERAVDAFLKEARVRYGR